MQALARELQEERKQPKVWEYSPKDVREATVNFVKDGKVVFSTNFVRDLPKSPIREIAEKYATQDGGYCEEIAATIESAITEAMALKK